MTYGLSVNEHNPEGWERMVQTQEGLSDKDDTEANTKMQVGCRESLAQFSLQPQPVQSKISELDPVPGRGNLESGQWTKD